MEETGIGLYVVLTAEDELTQLGFILSSPSVSEPV